MFAYHYCCILLVLGFFISSHFRSLLIAYGFSLFFQFPDFSPATIFGISPASPVISRSGTPDLSVDPFFNFSLHNNIRLAIEIGIQR